MRSANLDAANKTQAKIDELKTEAQGVANEAPPNRVPTTKWIVQRYTRRDGWLCKNDKAQYISI